MKTRRDSMPRDQTVRDVDEEKVLIKDRDRKLKSESLPPPTPHRRMSQELNEYVVKMNNIMSDLEYEVVGSALMTTSIDEKKSQLERARRLRNKVKEIKDTYESLLSRLEDAQGKVIDVIEFNDRAYRDHLLFKECCSEFSTWIRTVRNKVPSLSAGNLSDRLSLESSLVTFSQLKQENQSYGQQLLDKVKIAAAAAKETSSADGKTLIQNNVDNLEKDFNEIFNGIDKTINEIVQTQIELRNFKEEFEKVNEWLQGMDKEIRQERSECRASSLDQKQENVRNCQLLLNEFNHFKETAIKQLGRKEFLLKSHLETYARSQLMIVDSRFQVLMNLLTEVMAKVTSIADQHSQFKERTDAASSYMQVSIEMLNDLDVDQDGRNKQELESGLQFCKELQKRNQEEGQPLVYQALDAGSKALATTHGDEGRDDVARDIQDMKNQWEKFLAHVHEVSSKIVAAIVKAQDHEVRLLKVVSSLEEHEKRLIEIQSKPADPLSLPLDQVSKTKLRRLDSLLQEVLTYEGLITTLDQDDDTRIRYHDLLADVKQELSDAHAMYDTLDDCNTAIISLNEWIKETTENLSQYSGKQESGRNSVDQKKEFVKQLQSQGQQKLDLCIRLCESAGSRQPSECQPLAVIIDKCQSDFEELDQQISAFTESLESESKQWQDYENEFNDCYDFLESMDQLVIRFKEHLPDLLKKRSRLEEFQQKHLQSIFEKEGQFLQLNTKAQSLAEREEIESLCTRYSSLVMTGRDLIHSLEQKYQEHQQLNQMLLEANEFLEGSNEKIESYQEGIYSSSLDDLNLNISTLRTLISSVSSSSDSKVQYIMELADRVIACTHPSGTDMIRDSVAHIVKEYASLLQELNDILQEYEDRVAYIKDLLIDKESHIHHDQPDESNQEPLQFYPKWSYVLHACHMTQ